MRYANEVLEDLEALPFGDIEGDHVLLDKYTVETLKLCLERFDYEDQYDDLHNLVRFLIQKWEVLREEFWYA